MKRPAGARGFPPAHFRVRRETVTQLRQVILLNRTRWGSVRCLIYLCFLQMFGVVIKTSFPCTVMTRKYSRSNTLWRMLS